MLLNLWNSIKPAIFWSYRRGSWQYDLIVAAILAFIFLTPAAIFHDGPRDSTVERVEASRADGAEVFVISPEDLRGVPEAQQITRFEELLEKRTGSAYHVVDSKAATDEEGGVRTYFVYAKPPSPAP